MLPHQRSGLSGSRSKVIVPSKVRICLHRWTSPSISKSCPLKDPQRITVTTDASLFGWGAHCQSISAQGCWSHTELLNNIYWLELRAVHFAQGGPFCSPQLPFPHPSTKHPYLDNVTAKAHINRRGTHSLLLMQEAERR
uniref:Uncharacterized protein n=1 Tax=Micrurus spixii TaxID=129469 RepID=A0A2D4N610_9SAUR